MAALLGSDEALRLVRLGRWDEADSAVSRRSTPPSAACTRRRRSPGAP